MRAARTVRTWWSGALCAMVLAGCGGATSDPAQGPVEATSAAAPAAPSQEPATEATGLEGATLHGVSASADGLVAVGSDGSAAAAWSSADGRAWQPVDLSGAGAADALHAVAVDGGQGLAFGAAEPEPSALWSAATPPWEPADSSGIDGRVNAVAGDGQRWVAAGDLVDAETGTAAAGAVWTSDGDGRWQRLAELALNEGTVSDVAVDGDTVVVTGFDVDGGRVWTATGGDDLRAAEDGDFAAATIQGVARTASGYVALGRSLGDLRPLLWRSDDGRAWTREELPADAFAADLQINDLTVVDGTLIAVGAAPEGGAVWTSRDGAAWTLHATAGATPGASEQGT